MAIEFLDHTADIALRATGETLEATFEEAARGLFATMADVHAIQPVEAHSVRVRAASLEALLVAWLADLLVQKDLDGLVFSRFDVNIESDEDAYTLRGIAKGEPLDPIRHRPGCEVKGISLLGLRVERIPGGWASQCVFDV